ncbi:MAG: hypothetical protein WB630_22275, partial [Candidatus Acidiferrales bacterium]
ALHDRMTHVTDSDKSKFISFLGDGVHGEAPFVRCRTSSLLLGLGFVFVFDEINWMAARWILGRGDAFLPGTP